MACALQIRTALVIFVLAVFAFPGTASSEELTEFCDLYRQILDSETEQATVSDDELDNCDSKTRIAIKHALGLSVDRREYINAGGTTDVFTIINVARTFSEKYYDAGFMITEIAVSEMRTYFRKYRDEKRVEVYFYQIYKMRSKFIAKLSNSGRLIAKYNALTRGMETRVENVFELPDHHGDRIAECFARFDNFQVNVDDIASSAAFTNCLK